MKREDMTLERQWVYNLKDFSLISGISQKRILEYIREGMPCCKDGNLFSIEPVTARRWIQQRHINREGLTRKTPQNNIFGMELA